MEDKTATLSDADNVWTELRHMHMREAIDKLMMDFNQFLQDNAGFKGCVIALSIWQEAISYVIVFFSLLMWWSAEKALRT